MVADDPEAPPLLRVIEEAQRQLEICNACRYCEGYCAVFPSLARRIELGTGDVSHIANLCHDCRACFYACMYAPPHPFAIDLPKALSEVRVETYAGYGWPALASRLFGAGVRGALLAAGGGLAVILGAIFAFGPPHRLIDTHTGPGAFYQVIPYLGMVLPFLALAAWVVVAMVASGVRFWRETGGGLSDLLAPGVVAAAARDALELRYLSGGGEGCRYPDELPSMARRWLHALVFYGFLADLAATTIAAIMQDLFGIEPPFALLSAPVVLGVLGGIGLIAGTTGLLLLKWRSDARPASARMVARDYGLLASLDVVAITGMLTLALRSTPALGVVLAIHLASLVSLFLTMPYGKFVHFVYRYAALVRDQVERRT